MNAIIISALWGVLMMYMGFMDKNNKATLGFAILGVAAVLVSNWLEYLGVPFFSIETNGMLIYDRFGLMFSNVVLFCTLLYFILSGDTIIKTTKSPSDHFALIFFIIFNGVLGFSYHLVEQLIIKFIYQLFFFRFNFIIVLLKS